VSGAIEIIAETKEYRLYARENCVAMVHFTQSGDACIGSSGIMTESGLAFLLWREGRPLLVSKGGETPAAPEQVEALRRFAEDLKAFLATI
jgi:hypothetical protein